MPKEETQIISVQEWLDENYPLEQRSEFKVLNISGYNKGNEKLTGSLNLSDFINNWLFK